MAETAQSTATDEEITRFSALAGDWWDPKGPMRPLHEMNPLRLGYIRSVIDRHMAPGNDLKPLRGKRVADLGCGAGLLTEPMARLGAEVVGLDASDDVIRAARLHAGEAGLDIDYRAGTPEMLADAGETFDLLLSLEVMEHVPDVGDYVALCRDLARPGAPFVFSTLNRTPQSFVTAIVGAEYVLRMLPRGTHNWRRFIRPSELRRVLAANGFDARDFTGMVFSPLARDWRLSGRLGVNYIGCGLAD